MKSRALASMCKQVHDQSHPVFRAETFAQLPKGLTPRDPADALKFQARVYVVLDLAGKQEPKILRPAQ